MVGRCHGKFDGPFPPGGGAQDKLGDIDAGHLGRPATVSYTNIPTTNAVNIADYEMLFRRAMADHDAVIHINIGMGFSSCYQNAKLAAEEVPAVYVVDSRNLTVGHGMLVLAAAEAAERGLSLLNI